MNFMKEMADGATKEIMRDENSSSSFFQSLGVRGRELNFENLEKKKSSKKTGFFFASIINFINLPTAGESVSDQYGRVGEK